MSVTDKWAESMAQRFHETYERLAPVYDYETGKATAVPWEMVPENNKRLMIATIKEIYEGLPDVRYDLIHDEHGRRLRLWVNDVLQFDGSDWSKMMVDRSGATDG